MQLAIISCDGVQLLSNEPFPLQANIKACHWGRKLVFHDLQNIGMALLSCSGLLLSTMRILQHYDGQHSFDGMLGDSWMCGQGSPSMPSGMDFTGCEVTLEAGIADAPLTDCACCSKGTPQQARAIK